MAESPLTPTGPDSEQTTASKLTGLTYRQLNEWDKRGLLPHTRVGKSGWRRVNKWQAISIRILADLHGEFGIPLARLRRLLRWLTGEIPLRDATSDFHVAGAFACLILPFKGGSGAEVRRERYLIQSDLKRQLHRGRREARHGTGHLLQEVLSRLTSEMCLRGWESEQASEFARAALSLGAPGTTGAGSTDQLFSLEEAAIASGDVGALQTVRLLGKLLMPVSGAVMCARTGFASSFVTNLICGSFLTEPDLLEETLSGLLWSRSIHLYVTEHVNSVLAAMGQETFPVTMHVRDIQALVPKDREEQEQAILDLLRDGADSLSRIVIEPKKGFYRVIREEEIDPESAEEISDLVKQHDYQTITIKVRDGKIFRASRAASQRLERGDPADDDR